MLRSGALLHKSGILFRPSGSLRGRFCLLLLIGAFLAGGFRVHFLGYGRYGTGQINSYRKSVGLSGFVYRSVWNSDRKLTFVNKNIKAVLDASALSDERFDEMARGAFVCLSGYYIYEPEPPRNPGLFDYRQYLMSRGVNYSIKLYEDGAEAVSPGWDNVFPGILHLPGSFLRFHISALLTSSLGEDEGRLTGAVMTGDTGKMDNDAKETLRNGGISHLMAVSGMHVTFILMPSGMLVKNRKTGFRARQILLIFPLLAFIMIADFSSSVMRAAISAVFSFIARFSGRPPDRVNALCFSAALQIALNPYVIFGAGFLMTYAAALALIFVCPFVRRLIPGTRYKERRGVRRVRLLNIESLCSGISVNLSMMPLSALLFGSFSPIGLITTLYASPLSAGICTLGYGLCALKALDFMYIFRPLAWLLENFMKWLCGLVSLIARLGEGLGSPLGHVNVGKPPVWVIILWYLALLAILSPLRMKLIRFFKKAWAKDKRGRMIRASFALSLIAVIVLGVFAVIEIPVIEALVIDVGQGSSTLIKTEGYAGVIDAGDGKTDIVKIVMAQGVEKLDFIVITHGHLDHTGGLEILTGNFPPGTMYVSRDDSESMMRARRTAKEAGWNVVTVDNGDMVRLGKTSMAFFVAEDFFGGRSDADENNASLNVIFSCEYGSLTVTGDLQKEGEEALVRMEAFTDTDVLVVPHHGSASGSGVKMLSLTSPEYAIISAGRKNSYGHPSGETVERLVNANAVVLRTDTGGGIRLVIGRRGIFRREQVKVWRTI